MDGQALEVDCHYSDDSVFEYLVIGELLKELRLITLMMPREATEDYYNDYLMLQFPSIWMEGSCLKELPLTSSI